MCIFENGKWVITLRVSVLFSFFNQRRFKLIDTILLEWMSLRHVIFLFYDSIMKIWFDICSKLSFQFYVNPFWDNVRSIDLLFMQSPYNFPFCSLQIIAFHENINYKNAFAPIAFISLYLCNAFIILKINWKCRYSCNEYEKQRMY
jgi:hypothetical protein